jgi:hypothetical protein
MTNTSPISDCIGADCRSPMACGAFGYCRELNFRAQEKDGYFICSKCGVRLSEMDTIPCELMECPITDEPLI